MKWRVFTIISILLLPFFTGCNIAAGSYPYAAVYEIKTKEEDLIKAIQDFKRDNPEFNVPGQLQISDGRDTSDLNSLWYHVYFYYPQEKQIINTWTRPSNSGGTSFAFVGVNEGIVLGNWKEINKDFNSAGNKEVKKKFEERIVSKVIAYLH